MLFHVAWEFNDRSEEGEKRTLAVFARWQPPAGADFKGFYGFADGGGGVVSDPGIVTAMLACTLNFPAASYA